MSIVADSNVTIAQSGIVSGIFFSPELPSDLNLKRWMLIFARDQCVAMKEVWTLMEMKGVIRLLPIEERISILRDGIIAWKNPDVHNAERNGDN